MREGTGGEERGCGELCFSLGLALPEALNRATGTSPCNTCTATRKNGAPHWDTSSLPKPVVLFAASGIVVPCREGRS